MNFPRLVVVSLGVLCLSSFPDVRATLLTGTACPVGNAPAAMHCPGDHFTTVTYNVSTDPLDTSKRYLHTICVNLNTICSLAVETDPNAIVSYVNSDISTPNPPNECDNSISLCDSKCPEPTTPALPAATLPAVFPPVAAPGLVSLCCPNTNTAIGATPSRLRCATLNVKKLSTQPSNAQCAGP